jgi:hypothetical protein
MPFLAEVTLVVGCAMGPQVANTGAAPVRRKFDVNAFSEVGAEYAMFR